MITANDNGVLHTLGAVSVNVSGVLHELNSVHTNDGGVLKEIFRASKPLSSLNVGNIVKIKENGAPEDYIIVHKGNPDPTLYDSSCDGIWTLRKDIYENRVWDSSNNDYGNSDIKTNLNSTFYNLFDANAKKAIKTVKIPYHNGTGNSGNIASGLWGLSCHVFLLSGYEVGWTKSTNQYLPVDGACLSYFSGTASKRIGYYNGSATNWFLRSPNTSDNSFAFIVSATGSCGSSLYHSGYGVRPAFILSDTVRVDSDGNILV